jgi:hypothetical protein
MKVHLVDVEAGICHSMGERRPVVMELVLAGLSWNLPPERSRRKERVLKAGMACRA